MDPALGDFSTAVAAQLTEFINGRVREGWEFAWWPEATTIETRTVETTAGNFVGLDQTGQTAIGEVRRVWRRDPRSSTAPDALGFWMGEHGLQLGTDAPATVVVEFRKRPPEFSSTVWDTAATYAAGDLAYVAATGQCYLALQGGAAKNPVTETASWAVVEFPYVLANFVKRAAYADALLDDGQDDKAARNEENAYRLLWDAADIAEPQQGQYSRATVAAAPGGLDRDEFSGSGLV
jgi:hypothetical protein